MLHLTLLSLFPILIDSIALFGGIPVPGRTVPVLRLFDNYGSSCRPAGKRDFTMDQLAEFMHTLNAEDMAKKIYGSLFDTLGDLDAAKLSGTWYRMVDSLSMHKDDCAIYEFDLLSKADYTATFSSIEHVMKNGEVEVHHGFGRQMGTGPGEILLNTGHPADPCPYFPVKTGGLDSDGNYNYIVFSTPLKHPTMVLARDPKLFEKLHYNEVYLFLEKRGFLSPVAALQTRLHFTSATQCQKAYMLYGSQ